MLEQLLDSAFKKIRGQGKITEENIAESLREIRIAFLAADVNYKTTKEFIKNLKERAIGEKVIQSISPGQLLIKITQDELTQLLGSQSAEPEYNTSPPVQIMVMGLQGSGKTTFCGKLSLYLRNQKKKKPLLVAADVYRPAAIQQLQTLGKSLNIPVYEEGQGNPVSIIKNAKKYAKEKDCDAIIYDTAGRLQIEDTLMGELKEIDKAVKPNHKYFVADAMMGQDAVNVAKTFNESLDITGVVLTKMDGDTRGGAALSVRSVTGKPLIYVGTGEKPDALELFHPERVASRILGMGDIVSLVEKAQSALDEKEAQKMEKKLLKNKFDLHDFQQQLQSIQKMGSVSDLMGMIPGMSKRNTSAIDDKQLVYTEVILSSMTNQEKSNPKILDASRRRRIANGSGTDLQRVNQMLKQFSQMRKMMKQVTSMSSKKGGQMRKMMKQMQQGGGFPRM